MRMNFTNESTVTTSHVLASVDLKKKNILLLGSDRCVSDLFEQQLYAHGYQVQQKHRDENLLISISNTNPDLILLDIGFSNLAMLNIISQIKGIFSGPIVLLTSRNSEQEQVTAFNLGIDEYLVKPISENILNVRIDALLRRSMKRVDVDDKAQIQVGNLNLFPYSFKCQLAGKDISLTQFEFKLLRLLADNAGKIMSRDFIYTNILGREYNGCERTVDVRVSQLRNKLTKKGEKEVRIETVWGQGYMLSLVN